MKYRLLALGKKLSCVLHLCIQQSKSIAIAYISVTTPYYVSHLIIQVVYFCFLLRKAIFKLIVSGTRLYVY